MVIVLLKPTLNIFRLTNVNLVALLIIYRVNNEHLLNDIPLYLRCTAESYPGLQLEGQLTIFLQRAFWNESNFALTQKPALLPFPKNGLITARL